MKYDIWGEKYFLNAYVTLYHLKYVYAIKEL